MSKYIINADDFGLSSNVNEAILESFNLGLISSTTVLANMPGFDDAVALSKHVVFQNRIGVHLNLFEGTPLTNEMRSCRVFSNENGDFHQEALNFLGPYRMDKKIVFDELKAQISKVIDSGIKPTHLDSHAHRHTNIFVAHEVVRLSKYFNIPKIRLSGNVRNRNNYITGVKVFLFNLFLRVNDIKCTNYLGVIPDIVGSKNQLEGIVEVIVHPIYKNNILSDLEYEGGLEELLLTFKTDKLLSYYEI